MMSSPALARSPLITLNTATPPLDTRGASPYVQRVKLNPDLEKPFLS